MWNRTVCPGGVCDLRPRYPGWSQSRAITYELVRKAESPFPPQTRCIGISTLMGSPEVHTHVNMDYTHSTKALSHQKASLTNLSLLPKVFIVVSHRMRFSMVFSPVNGKFTQKVHLIKANQLLGLRFSNGLNCSFLQ